MDNNYSHSHLDAEQQAHVLAVTGKKYHDCREHDLVAAGIDPLNPFTRRRVDPIVLKRLGKPWSECTMGELDALLLEFEAEAACKDAVIAELERQIQDDQ